MHTRFAPSPTGWLHLGHAFSAMMAWNEAQRAGGAFLLRIEDIDTGRCRAEYEAAIIEDLTWLGLRWPQPVWRQSERLADYAAALERLERLGVLYPCFCTRQEIALSAPQGRDGPAYAGTCRGLSRDERRRLMATGKAWSLRLDAARALRLAGPLTWIDLDRGVQKVEASPPDDAVLARKDTPASYHLAVTVDDAAQHITVVTRGEDLFSSTHLHRLLIALLDLPVPVWRHHPLICDQNGKRLAKRDDARAIRTLREAGASPADVLGLTGL